MVKETKLITSNVFFCVSVCYMKEIIDNCSHTVLFEFISDKLCKLDALFYYLKRVDENSTFYSKL